jgi:hypothetical protein
MTQISSAMADFIYKAGQKKTVSSSCHNGAWANNLLGMNYYGPTLKFPAIFLTMAEFST